MSALPGRWRTAASWLPLGAAVIAVVALNLAGLPGAFLGDDLSHLYTIGIADREGRLGAWLLDRFHQPLSSANYAFRPFAFASYALDWKLYGAHPVGWHLTNLCLHFANAGLLWLVVRRWFRADDARPRAVLAVMFFLAFPFAGEVTFWLVGRFDLLAATMSLAFLATLDGRSSPASLARHAARIAALLLALMAKESALPLPLVALLVDAALHDPPAQRSYTKALAARIAFALRDLAPVLVAFALYLGLRIALFGTPFKVYPISSFPVSFGDYLDRLGTLVHMVSRQTDSSPPWLWGAVAALLLGATLVRGGSRESHRTAPRVVAVAAAAAVGTLVYILAPSLSFPAASYEGGGARSYYLAWLYLSLLLGVVAGPDVVARRIGYVAIAWMLVGASASLGAWHQAGRYMRSVTAAVPAFAGTLDSGNYALLALPDRIGIALFARNAQGALVNRPLQAADHVNAVVGVTEIGDWKSRLEGSTFAALRGEKHFDMRNFAGVYCFNPALGRFVRIAPGGGATDFEQWASALRASIVPAGCLPQTLEERPP